MKRPGRSSTSNIEIAVDHCGMDAIIRLNGRIDADIVFAPHGKEAPRETLSIEMPGILLETQPDPAGLVESAMDTGSIVVFGQQPQSLSGGRRRGRPAVPEQASLCVTTAVSRTDLCWRDPYPSIPAEWAGFGSVVEAGNRFQTMTRATVELWATTYKYGDARQNAIRHQMLPATLVETALSDAHGAFTFNALQRNKKVRPAFFEIRVHMPDEERGLAYTEIGTGLSPQWMGRGIKIALAQEGNGCSRIYSSGLDDTDCGSFDCEKLPAGLAKIVAADGTPLANTRLTFYRHSKNRRKDPEFSLTTEANGMITSPAQRGCFDIAIRHGRSIHLCFSGQAASETITVVLPPTPNP